MRPPHGNRLGESGAHGWVWCGAEREAFGAAQECRDVIGEEVTDRAGEASGDERNLAVLAETVLDGVRDLPNVIDR